MYPDASDNCPCAHLSGNAKVKEDIPFHYQEENHRIGFFFLHEDYGTTPVDTAAVDWADDFIKRKDVPSSNLPGPALHICITVTTLS